MTPNRLITLAIHTYDLALSIKSLLEREGIYVELNNVNLAEPTVAAGVRIRIRETDLAKALRIVENIEIFNIPAEDKRAEGGEILVPTDFSPHSGKAVELAFRLASVLGCRVTLLHTFMTPGVDPAPQLTDAYDYQLGDIAEAETIEKETQQSMDDFKADLRRRIRDGELPAAKFSTEIVAGLPEEVILNYSREHSPQLIVMGTRGAHKKETELIGSVTAEVLDGCRTPAFTVPENADVKELVNLRKVAFICNLDQQDLIAIDSFYRLFPDLKLDVMLIHVPGRREWGLRPEAMQFRKNSDKSVRNLQLYCKAHFPGYTFHSHTVELSHLLDDFARIMSENEFQLICLPNKKKTVFARLFNPSLAHKILFRADVPMMVIPV